MANSNRRAAPGGRALRLKVFALSALLAPFGHAMDYSASGELNVDAEHDNNIQMQPKRATSAYGATVAPSLTLRAANEVSEVALGGTLWFRRFNRTDFDTNDQSLNLSVRHMLEHDELGIVLQGTRDSTLTSEYLDSGRITNASRHEQYVAAPSWTHYLGERDLLTIRGSFSRNQYESDSYTSYNYWQASLRWTHVLNERLRLFLEGQHSDYKTDSSDTYLGKFHIQTYHTSSIDNGIQIGGLYSLSEQLSVTALFGRATDKTRYITKYGESECINRLSERLDWLGILYISQCLLENLNSENQLSTLDAGLNWSNERHQLGVHATQQTQPSSDGYTLKSSQLSADWNWQMWERGSVRLDVTFGRNRALSGNGNARIEQQSDRTFGYTTLAYYHTLNENWSVNCRYQYRYQKYNELDVLANSQAVFLGFSYKPRELHWSR